MEIKKLFRNCGFVKQESRMVQDRMVLGTSDKHLRKPLLEIDLLDLAKAIAMARTAEIVINQVKHLHKPPGINQQTIEERRGRTI